MMIRLPSQVYEKKDALPYSRVRAINYVSCSAETEVPRSVNANLCSSGCKNCPWVDFKDFEECGLRFPQRGSI
jgi:hypothetical protein